MYIALPEPQLPAIQWDSVLLADSELDYAPVGGTRLLLWNVDNGFLLPFLKDPRGWDLDGHAHTRHRFFWDVTQLSFCSKLVRHSLKVALKASWAFEQALSVILFNRAFILDEPSLIQFLEPWGFGCQGLANTCWTCYMFVKKQFKLLILAAWATDPDYGPMTLSRASQKVNCKYHKFWYFRLSWLHHLGYLGFREMYVQDNPDQLPYRVLSSRSFPRTIVATFAGSSFARRSFLAPLPSSRRFM